MQEIKFRGKTFGGKWVEGYYVVEKSTGKHKITDGLLDIDEVKVETIGMGTGVLDKDGKEIYEGDIIVRHAEAMPGIRGAVVYDEANARFGMAYTSYWESGSVTHFDTLERVKCYSDRNRELKYEVIGNVHDNPKLIKRH